jgi:hypothetical protein
MKTLKLTLHKKAFEVMVTGEKQYEYRNPSNWILSRLCGKNTRKEYKFVKFTNGYGADKPYFVAEFLGFDAVDFSEYSVKSTIMTYSNGLTVEIQEGDIAIRIGKIMETGNINDF